MISEIGKQAQRGLRACLSSTAVLWIELGFESVDEFFFFWTNLGVCCCVGFL